MKQYLSGKEKEKEGLKENLIAPNNKFYNVYTIFAFFLGILSTCLLASLIAWFSDFTSNNFIQFFSIVINICVGIIIYLIVEKKTGDDRVVKDIFQQDLKDIKSHYKTFLLTVNRGEYGAQDINKWFKLMSINIMQFEYFLKTELGFKSEECTLQKANREIQMALTGSKEFNDNFDKGKIKFGSPTTSQVIDLNKNLKHNFTRTAVKISRA